MKIFVIIVEKIGKPAAAGGGAILLFLFLYFINLFILQVKFWNCSPDNIELSIQEVIQDDGYYEYNDSYVTTVRLRIKNNNPLDISSFSGNMVIYNADGEKLVEATDRFTFGSSNCAKGEEIIMDMYTSGLDNAKGKELYFSKTGDLGATFQFTKIEYTWNKEKEYENNDPITILDLKLEEGGITATEKTYLEALDAYNKGFYEEAASMFEELEQYKDSYTYFVICTNEINYAKAVSMYEQGNYADAKNLFNSLGIYKDSADYYDDCCEKEKEILYQEALSFMNNEKYAEAISAFSELSKEDDGYKDGCDKIREVIELGLAKAEAFADEGDYEAAYDIAHQLEHDDYYDKTEYITQAYKSAKELDFASAVHYGLKKVIIPEGVEEIPSNYFEGSCVEIVVLPDSVKRIDEAAFKNCKSLYSINLPDGLLIIGDQAFMGCSGLRDAIVIGNSVVSIGSKAFASCVNLVSVKIGDSVTSIGDNAFESCTSLTTITIPASVSGIGSGAFSYCYRLVEVINASGLVMEKGSSQNGGIAKYAIEVHSSGSKLVKTDGYLFYTSNGINYLVGYDGEDTDVVLPESYKDGAYVIHNYAFYKMNSIVSVSISDRVTAIGDKAFYSCENLESVSIGDAVTKVGSGAFESCRKMNALSIGKAVVTIEADAFRYCASLTSIRIPSSVARIEQYAFYDCASLKNVTFENVSNWYASSSDAETGGHAIPSLENTSNAADYLTSYYASYYWNRRQL